MPRATERIALFLPCDFDKSAFTGERIFDEYRASIGGTPDRAPCVRDIGQLYQVLDWR